MTAEIFVLFLIGLAGAFIAGCCFGFWLCGAERSTKPYGTDNS